MLEQSFGEVSHVPASSCSRDAINTKHLTIGYFNRLVCTVSRWFNIQLRSIQQTSSQNDARNSQFLVVWIPVD